VSPVPGPGLFLQNVLANLAWHLFIRTFLGNLFSVTVTWEPCLKICPGILQGILFLYCSCSSKNCFEVVLGKLFRVTWTTCSWEPCLTTLPVNLFSKTSLTKLFLETCAWKPFLGTLLWKLAWEPVPGNLARNLLFGTFLKKLVLGTLLANLFLGPCSSNPWLRTLLGNLFLGNLFLETLLG
jgi:hypothetical protein